MQEESVYDGFTDNQDIISNYEAPADALDGAIVHLAVYRYEDLSGSSSVIFEKEGKLFEVYGSHCSCYGLEEQWSPSETSWGALELRDYPEDETHAHLREMIVQHGG